MYREVSNLLLYSDLPQDSILLRLAGIFEEWEIGDCGREALVKRIYKEVKRLLDLATKYGFDHNLWQNYLTFLLITNENSFSLTCERAGAGSGSVNHFAKSDFKVFQALFHFDFGSLERDLGIDCFSVLTDYTAIPKQERRYNKSISEKVQRLSLDLAQARDEAELFQHITGFYRDFGVGMFGLNRAFRIRNQEGTVLFSPVSNSDTIRLEDLIGYDNQKRQLISNTEAFVDGRSANNVLLYGDSGTGKSSSVKALINEYYDRGLRMIELYKHQFRDLSAVIAQIKNRNYRFILFIDDLSFEENEIEYKFLKAVIEGGVETKPDNILIYATSNRRHLIRESWSDRNDMEYDDEIHRSDTMEEKLSLSSRFGILINYSTPDRKDFFRIVDSLAARQKITGLSEEQLHAQAVKWELRHGGVSGRTAQQFINYLAAETASLPSIESTVGLP